MVDRDLTIDYQSDSIERILGYPLATISGRQRHRASRERVVHRAPLSDRVPPGGRGSMPLVIVVDAAEELRDDELDMAIEAAGHTSRAVILRIIRDG